MTDAPPPALPTPRPVAPAPAWSRSQMLWAAGLAFAISPLAGVLSFSVGLCALEPHRCTLGSVSAVTAVLVPFAYAAGLILGLPAWIVMRALGLTRAWQVMLAGAAVAGVGSWAVLPDFESATHIAVVLFAPGCIAGLIFWCTAFRPFERR